MDNFLRVDQGLPSSGSSVFLTDDSASICPLIAPSPPTNALINPLPEPTEPSFQIGEELCEKLQHIKDKDDGDTASSTSSADPLNHNSMYHHIVKDEESATQERENDNPPIQLTFKNPPEDYFFMTWNWPLIRKISLYMFLSGLVAMVALVVGMIWNLPKTCNPPTQWYQGNLFYTIFPASFSSSAENKSQGDIKGITLKADYIANLGVRVVRLNSIFHSEKYPLDFKDVKNLTQVEPNLGTLDDVKELISTLNGKNISVVLDLPIHHVLKPNLTVVPSEDPIEDAMQFWITQGVEGFYLKGLENFAHDANLALSLRRWKKKLGPDRIIIVSNELIKAVTKSIDTVLSNVDLVDVKLDIPTSEEEKKLVGVKIKQQIEQILQNGTLFSRKDMPWIHWSLADVNSKRLANVLPDVNATLGATILQMMLPGTPSIYYGDEIGLKQTADDARHLFQLEMIPWNNHTVESWTGEKPSFPHFDQTHVIAKMAKLRQESPSIYMNAVIRDGDYRANAKIKYSQDNFLVIQRWYPRRKAFVVASNLGKNGTISLNLSNLFYTGRVLVGPRSDSAPVTISFKDITLWPGESVVIVLD